MGVPDMSTGFAVLLGLRFEETTPDRVTIRWDCRPDLLQPWGIQHGGVYCSVVETAASVGAALWYGARGRVVGVSNQTDFLRPVRGGELIAVAEPVHRGRSQQLWQVRITDAPGRLVAQGQVRLQNLAASPSSPTPDPASPAPGAPTPSSPAADSPAPGATAPTSAGAA